TRSALELPRTSRVPALGPAMTRRTIQRTMPLRQGEPLGCALPAERGVWRKVALEAVSVALPASSLRTPAAPWYRPAGLVKPVVGGHGPDFVQLGCRGGTLMRALSFFVSRTRLRAVLSTAGVCASTLALIPAAAQAATPGTLDTGFGSGGIAPTQAGIRFFGAAVQSDGKTVATGSAGGTLIVARFTAGGQLDGSFGSGGIAHSPAITGTLDTGSLGRSVAVQSDGKIVVAGKVTSADGTSTDAILVERFNSNGSIDGSFGSGGVVKAATTAQGDGYGVAIQSDGKIVAVGSANAVGQGGSAPRVAVVRLNSNGSPDTTFRGGGTDILDFGAYSVAQAVA